MADSRRVDPLAVPPPRYDTVPNVLPDIAMIGTGAGAVRVQRDSPLVITTPLPEQSWFHKHEPLVIGTASVVIVLSLWQLMGVVREQKIELPLGITMPSRLFLPSPSDVIASFGDLIADGELAQDLAVSGQEFFIGYFSAAITGIVLGLLLGWYPRVRYAFDPFVNFLYATPRIVLLPLFIIWFGIGVESKIAVIFLGAFFAILINTTAGVRNLDAHLIRVAHSFGANDLTIFKTIALPGSVPFILTGLRLGIGHALIGVVVGELVAAQHGIGRMMAIAGATFQSSKVFAGLVFIAATGMLLTYILQRLERHFDAWRPQR
ncbi:MAG TPA: ABC transporter permease [Methylomirabilota bacterium]|nr:ABC transporter permease [Methylomirabilota bacterium]